MAAALAMAAVACTGGGSGGHGSIADGQSATASKAPVKKGGTITVAAVSAVPDFIFPLVPATNQNGWNANLTEALWPYLVYPGDGAKSEVNKEKSLFSSLDWSNGDKQLTIHLKDWNWSDGKPITSRDFTFVYNLLKANSKNWAAHLPGLFPDDVAKESTPDAHTVVLDLTRSYNPDFYTDDVLSTIPLLPQHAWDKTSATGAVGDNDTTTAGAKAVYSFLQKEGAKTADFAGNPLWQVVDGPWKLKEFRTNGYYSYVPNPAYSGASKPSVDKLVMSPFTTDTPELNALRSGSSLDVAGLPLNDVKQAEALRSSGYSIASVPIPGVAGILPNLYNAKVGPVLQQLYVRQALQYLINGPQIVSKVYNGYADPGYGPVPVKATGTWATPLEKSGGPYPYSPAKAKSLLTAHGWKVVPNGTTTCQSPGTGASQCGAGIKAGQALTFQMVYSSGRATTDEQEAAIKSSEAQAGITLNLKAEPFNTLIGTMGTCTAASHPSSTCGWQLSDFGYEPYPLYPNGTGFFDTGGEGNLGGYSDPTMDRLIKATEYGSSTKAFSEYEDYAAKQLPWLWVPLRSSLLVYRTKLQGVVPLNPFSGTVDYEDWAYTS
ncbi:peptide/nickel transport system substrate-binding protein [Actinacidiphila yanglinensis]|uniref:Peptide/nickel transport system substrate-binding protein n=1 Tax=Actinacidiphila yanglinensis TaxID=310779 RepID=A0A1H6E4I6_9ACTN|nr:peptide ABC transporter substrate-binding protein [Actinacidiphila yanglinensis]SEG91805.1 peptide/nickel transport system substrate-binding protein [Actinacidiphila yanglinensis]